MKRSFLSFRCECCSRSLSTKPCLWLSTSQCPATGKRPTTPQILIQGVRGMVENATPISIRMRMCVGVVTGLLAIAEIALPSTPPNYIVNGGFEITPGSSEFGWILETSIAPKGQMALSSDAYSGKYALKLTAGASNVLYDRDEGAFGVGQAIPAANFQGGPITVSAWLKADAGSVAVIREYRLHSNGSVTLQAFRQEAGTGWVFRRDVLSADPSTVYLIITCEVVGSTGSAYFDQISVSPGVATSWLEASGLPDPSTAPIAATVTVFPKQLVRTIPQTLYGSNFEWIWDGDGAWNPQAATPNTSILALTRSSGTTLFRFPGGVFSDFYTWGNGIGPPAQRPQTLSVPGGAVSANDFGTDEALTLAQNAGGQLLITVNVVTGTPQQAAAWVRYVNNGSRRVEYWELGNESYVSGSTPYVAAATMTPEVYAGRVLAFAEAMRAVDPGIKIGAIADENYSIATAQSYPDWTARMLSIAGNSIDFVSIHSGYAPSIAVDQGWTTRTVYASVLAAPTLIAERLDDLANRIDLAVPGRAGQIQIATTEWGPYFQTAPSARFLDHTKTLESALFVASTLKAFIESPRSIVATAFKLVDSAYLGWIGVRDGDYIAKPSLLAMQMYTQHFGSELVRSSTTAPTFDAPAIGGVDAAQAAYLDVVCSTNTAGDVLYIMAINKNFDRAVTARIELNEFAPAGTATVSSLSGLAPDSNTGTQLPTIPGLNWAPQALFGPLSEFNEGNPAAVAIETSQLSGIAQNFSYTFPAHSITSLALPRR